MKILVQVIFKNILLIHSCIKILAKESSENNYTPNTTQQNTKNTQLRNYNPTSTTQSRSQKNYNVVNTNTDNQSQIY